MAFGLICSAYAAIYLIPAKRFKAHIAPLVWECCKVGSNARQGAFLGLCKFPAGLQW
jgi:hypothetical protein